MALQAPDLVPRGAFLHVVLIEGNAPDVPATKSNLDAWVASAKAPYTTTLNPVDVLLQTFFGRSRETFITVDLATMKIVRIAQDGVAAALADLRSRL